LNGIDHTRLQIKQTGSRNVSFIISLIEEYIFAVVYRATGKLFENSIVVDPVLCTKLFPELRSNLQISNAYMSSGIKYGDALKRFQGIRN